MAPVCSFLFQMLFFLIRFFRQKVLQPMCKREVIQVIYESEIDPSLDPPFYQHCESEINRLCPDNVIQGHTHTALTECMKSQYQNHKITNEDCKKVRVQLLQAGASHYSLPENILFN